MTFFSTLIAQAPQLEEVIGQIDTPPGVDKQIETAQASGAIQGNENALLFFVSNLLKIGTIIAGLYVLFNILLAAYDLLSSQGKAEAYKKVRDKVTMSVVGLFIIVIAYTIGGLLGLILFGDAGYLLNPVF